MDLRPYQQQAVDAVQSAWAEGGRDPADMAASEAARTPQAMRAKRMQRQIE